MSFEYAQAAFSELLKEARRLEEENARLRKFLGVIGEYNCTTCGCHKEAREALAGDPFCECEADCEDCP